MKTIFQISAIAIVLLAFAFNSSAVAQSNPKANKGSNTTQVGPKFIDEDGDGVCDNKGTNTGRQYRNGGKGQGQGQGQGECTGDHQRLRLRDGSCGDTPANRTGAKQRKNTNSAK
ncbi:MAG: hypothetical protein M5R41_09410 [Bacteroidia bacterium]|nr:hypothetical protein [Bacteroidia bacterium]